MAEFSKEWCEIYDHHGIKPDFSIIDIAEDLEKGWCVYGYICEGFGIGGIAKSDSGKIMVEVDNEWKDFETFKQTYANQKN